MNALKVTGIFKPLSIVVIGLLSCLAHSEVSHKTDKVAVPFAIGDWIPYTSQKKPRYLEVVIQEAFALKGYDVVFNYYPWKRSYKRTQNGKSVGTFPWFVDKARGDEDNFIIPSESVLQENEVFFHRSDLAFDWTDYQDLKTLKIGGVIGYSHITRLQKYGLSMGAVPSEKQNFLMLAAGRVDLVPASKIVGKYMIQELFSEEEQGLITYHPKPLIQDDMYVFFSRTHPQGAYFSQLFDEAIRELKSSGRLEEITQYVLNQ